MEVTMLAEISQQVREKFKVFFLTDNLLFNNKVIPANPDNFSEISPGMEEKNIAYIDGGQAEIFSGGNMSLSFIRIFAQVMLGLKKQGSTCHEFYLLTTARYRQGDIWYESKIFPVKGVPLIGDISLASQDASIRQGNERGPISTLSAIARRYAELTMASQMKAEHVLLDGTLTATFSGEEKYLQPLGNHVSALAKTCSLFTTCGNNPAVLLQKLTSRQGCWSYFVDENTSFVKLYPQAKHIFRFDGNTDMLPSLLATSCDPLLPGYPYGLVLADQFARISHRERNGLKTSFFCLMRDKELLPYLNTTNAHEILDRL